MKLELDNGKYELTMEDNKITATRNGEEWRDLTGDNLVYFMMCHIADLEDTLGRLEDVLPCDIEEMLGG